MRHLTGAEMKEIEDVWFNCVYELAVMTRREDPLGIAEARRRARRFILMVAFSDGDTLPEMQHQFHNDPKFHAQVAHACHMMALLDQPEKTMNHLRYSQRDAVKRLMEKDLANWKARMDREILGPQEDE